MDTQVASYGDGPNVLRKVPRPLYSVQIYIGGPPPFSLEAQRKVLKWTHERGYFIPDPNWLNPPNVEGIREIVWPFMKPLGTKNIEDISVAFLADGGFNRVYTVDTLKGSYVFRVALPVDPHYKTESDVATTELVRHFTTIPVPIIYTYDSSANNTLGLEWILMEEITSGKELDDSWETMEYDTKVRLTETVADWTAQLSNIIFDKIGSIYMRFEQENLLFFVGRSVNYLLTQENRLLFDAPRGPFVMLESYYAVLLTIAKRDVEAVTQADESDLFEFELGKIQLEPALFLTRNPDLIDSVENFDEPEKEDLADPERQPDSEDPEEAAKAIKDNEEWYTRNLNDYQCTMLRQTFQEKLKDLESPLADAVWDDLPEFD
ncbi:hypothetical protein OEA41_001440 [Lepraria neglecta]|uniref:Aminoglycoside phosphotransferase domain-containing protein n=1 Tax=Lepraria neglecta TaxID=209136 RepID=A0AAE0DLI4_9LECA|nr:hypothetical protein OEA41_001440 [Lepraria neglecta]